MRLNVPIFEDLKQYNNILIIGIGGGFDIYCGLPLYLQLFFEGKNIVLANYSFTKFDELRKNTDSIFLTDNLVENKMFLNLMNYNPEGYLKEGLKQLFDVDQKIYSINRQGVIPTLDSINRIIQLNNIDCIIAVDGGVDSLFHGDEEGCGTVLEDTITSIALSHFKDIKKYLVCIGLTTEIEEKLCNYSAFKKISEYYRDDAVYGICSLTKSMEEFIFFENMCNYCWGQPNHKSSHISSRIIPAVKGQFGGDPAFYSFLMNLYFFFDFDKVIGKNILVDQLKNTNTFMDGVAIVKARTQNEKRQNLNL